jgi:hypothetical protein
VKCLSSENIDEVLRDDHEGFRGSLARTVSERKQYILANEKRKAK